MHALMIDALSIALLGLFVYLGSTHAQEINSIFDIGVYREIATRAAMMHGGEYPGVFSEYPPLATSLFWVARALSWNDFGAGFMTLYSLVAVGSYVIARRLSPLDGFIVALMFPLTIFLLGVDITFGRFDLFIAMFLLVAARAQGARKYGTCGFFFTLSILLKVVPILAVPVLVFLTPRRYLHRLAFGAFLALVVGFFVPISIIGLHGTIDNIRYMTSYHTGRGIQIESTWSGISFLFGLMNGHPVPVGFDHSALSNVALPPVITLLSKMIILFGVAIMSLRVIRIRTQANFQSLLTLILFFALLCAPVFSPQYLVWVIPIILSYAFDVIVRARERTKYFSSILATTLVIVVATNWLIFEHYSDLIQQTFAAVLVLNIRNAAILVLVIVLLYECKLLLPRFRLRTHESLWFELRELSYDFSMVGIAAYLLFFIVRPATIPHVSNVSYSDNHAAAPRYARELPLSLSEGHQQLQLSVTYFIPPLSRDRSLRIRQDDCLDHLTVNGYHVPAHQLNFCEASGPGRTFYLGEHLHSGANHIEATVRNTGGPMSFDIVPELSLFFRFILLLFLSTVVWCSYHLMQFGRLLNDPLISFFLRVRYTLLRAWIKRHSSRRISMKPSHDQQMGLCI